MHPDCDCWDRKRKNDPSLLRQQLADTQAKLEASERDLKHLQKVKLAFWLHRVEKAIPERSSEELNLVKCTEELGELAAFIFKGGTAEERMGEIADVVLCAVMDLNFIDATPEDLAEAIDRKLVRQEKRKALTQEEPTNDN
jgi:NTP pyrophosphatase (non-canonical NTP hydrolase)